MSSEDYIKQCRFATQPIATAWIETKEDLMKVVDGFIHTGFSGYPGIKAIFLDMLAYKENLEMLKARALELKFQDEAQIIQLHIDDYRTIIWRALS